MSGAKEQCKEKGSSMRKNHAKVQGQGRTHSEKENSEVSASCCLCQPLPLEPGGLQVQITIDMVSLETLWGDFPD